VKELQAENQQSEEAASELESDDTEAIVDVIEELVRERNSGFGFPDDLTELEKQLIMVWDETVRAYERAHQARVAQMFEVMMVMVTHR
jgi:hypothetical protein